MRLYTANIRTIFAPSKYSQPFKKSKAMKRQIVTMFALLVLSGSAVAKEKSDGPDVISVKITAPFQKLVVEGNVEVLLFENSLTFANVQGEKKSIDAVEFTQKDGVLTITAPSNGGDKAVVYLPVQHITMIEAWKDATVTSNTVLNSSDLTILLNDDCKVSVTATGKIKLLEGEETTMVVLKNVIKPINNSL